MNVKRKDIEYVIRREEAHFSKTVLPANTFDNKMRIVFTYCVVNNEMYVIDAINKELSREQKDYFLHKFVSVTSYELIEKIYTGFEKKPKDYIFKLVGDNENFYDVETIDDDNDSEQDYLDLSSPVFEIFRVSLSRDRKSIVGFEIKEDISISNKPVNTVIRVDHLELDVSQKEQFVGKEIVVEYQGKKKNRGGGGYYTLIKPSFVKFAK